jgi:hypothetical protein
MGGLSWAAKIAAVITLVVSSMKVSFLRGLIWDRLPSFLPKVIVAPALSLVAGTLLMVSGSGFSWSGLGAYLFAGLGSVILHELLDGIKNLPGIGATVQMVIGVIQGLLGGKKSA